MRYTGKPTTATLGLEQTTTLYKAELFDGAPDDEDPYQPAIVAAAEAAPADVPVQLDIEHWPVDSRLTGGEAAATASMDKLIQAIEWFRAAAPGLSVGYYGLAPIHAGSAPASGSKAQIEAWHDANTFLAPLVDAVDVIHPALYIRSDDIERWALAAVATIVEAKRIAPGKPIIPFIWPQYHTGAAPDELQGVYLSADDWTRQLTTLRMAGCAGVILWGPPGYEWDGDNDWWPATQTFIAGL